jgi:hypothetical protein
VSQSVSERASEPVSLLVGHSENESVTQWVRVSYSVSRSVSE